MAHTPGPWGVIWVDGCYVIDTKEGRVDIAKTVPRADWDSERANANLIAAAPELYDFVKEFIEAWADGMAGDGYLLNMAKEVLAKAEGK